MAVKVILALAAVPALNLVRVALLATARFNSTINLGAVLVGLLVIVVAGLFTLRSNVAKVWRENYEGEKAKADGLEEMLQKERAEVEASREREREIRHALKTELAAEKLKTDQTAVFKQLADMQAEGQKMTEEAVASLLEAQRSSEERLLGQVKSVADTTAAVAAIVQAMSERLGKVEQGQ